jgi:uncharacterized protein
MTRLWPTFLGCCALLISPARAQEPRMPPHIAVPSTATAEVTPDVAVLRLGVSTERRTAAEAASVNARSAQGLIDELAALGVEPRDARTLSVTLTPVYTDERDPNGRGGKRALTGYLARNTLQIRVRDVGKAGAVARALVDKGANVLEGVAFEISDGEARLDDLRAKAIGDAGRRARLYADALGLRLGRVLEISPEATFYPEGGVADVALRRAGAAEGSGPAIPIAPGVQKLQAQARVVWELVQ